MLDVAGRGEDVVNEIAMSNEAGLRKAVHATINLEQDGVVVDKGE